MHLPSPVAIHHDCEQLSKVSRPEMTAEHNDRDIKFESFWLLHDWVSRIGFPEEPGLFIDDCIVNLLSVALLLLFLE